MRSMISSIPPCLIRRSGARHTRLCALNGSCKISSICYNRLDDHPALDCFRFLLRFAALLGVAGKARAAERHPPLRRCQSRRGQCLSRGQQRLGDYRHPARYFEGRSTGRIGELRRGITDWSLAVIAIAPIAGHAFSPFLRFKGGKAIAVSLGIWCGLTLYQVPLVLGLILGIYIALFTNNGWSTVLGFASLIVYLLIIAAPAWMLGVWLGNLDHRRLETSR